jgi:hypothetical protein
MQTHRHDTLGHHHLGLAAINILMLMTYDLSGMVSEDFFALPLDHPTSVKS